MPELLMPQATDWINALEAGQRSGMVDRANAAKRTAGGLMASGDYKGAASALYSTGDFANGSTIAKAGYDQQAEATKLQRQQEVQAKLAAGDFSGAYQAAGTDTDLLGGLDKVAAHAKETTATMAAALQALKDPNTGQWLPPEVARQKYAEIKPGLQARGIDPAKLDGFDPTPGNLEAIQAETLGLAKQLDQAKPQVVAPGSSLVTPQGKSLYTAPRYEKLGDGESLLRVGGGSDAPGGPTPTGQAPAGGFDAVYHGFVAPHEGGYTAHDGNGAPANFGINQAANPEVDVAKLTPEAAKQILHDKYWTPSGAEKLPPALQAIQFDTAVNMGVGAAQNLLQQSGGDPATYLKLREDRYRAIAAADPSKASKLPVWLARNDDLANYVAGHGDAGAAPGAEVAPGVTVLAKGASKAPEWQSDGKGNLVNVKTGDRKIDTTSPAVGGAPTGDVNVAGSDYLKTLPASRAAQVQAMLDGRMAFPTSFALKTPYWQGMIADAAQVDPAFDAVNFAARVKTRADFTSGKNAQNIKALNTGIGHLDHLNSQIDGTARLGGFPGATLVNKGINAVERSSGDPGVTNYEQTASALATELTAIFRGSGGAEADVKRYLDQLNSNASEDQKKAAVKNISSLLRSRLDAIGSQYEQGMGTTKDPLTLLNPQAAAAFRRLSGEPATPPDGQPAPAPAPKSAANRTAAQAAKAATFTDYKAPPGSTTNPFVPTTEAQYNGLPRGAHYIHSDGSIRVKGG